MERRTDEKTEKKGQTDFNFQLLIDYDHKNRVRRWLFERRMRKRIEFLEDILPIGIELLTRTETNNGYHYVAAMTSGVGISPPFLNLIQCLLGDDWRRVVFNAKRLLNHWNWRYSNVFFDENEIKKPEEMK